MKLKIDKMNYRGLTPAVSLATPSASTFSSASSTSLRSWYSQSKIKIEGFDWDKGNKDKNLVKHNVGVKESEQVFFNKPILIFDDPKHSQKETRFVAYGKSEKGRKLTIIFTIRKKLIRIISARDQNPNERRVYEKT